MDGDPGVEPELDGFSLILPLPYRVAIILVAGKRRGCHDKKTVTELKRPLGLGS